MANRKLSTLSEKVEFLVKNPELINAGRQKIIVRMKAAGLIAKTTYWCDVKLDEIIKLTKSQLRRQGIYK